jgi:hypothetical protein
MKETNKMYGFLIAYTIVAVLSSGISDYFLFLFPQNPGQKPGTLVS